jgi:hypothetical protein
VMHPTTSGVSSDTRPPLRKKCQLSSITPRFRSPHPSTTDIAVPRSGMGLHGRNSRSIDSPRTAARSPSAPSRSVRKLRSSVGAKDPRLRHWADDS